MNKLYRTAKGLIGQRLSPLNKSYGCVEALSAVFKMAIGQELGENASTTKLYEKLLTDKRFKQAYSPDLGDIVISPTGYGQGNGHTGIISDNGQILSNNSITLEWDEHITWKTWQKRYASFPIVLFRFQFPPEPAIIKEDIEQKKISLLQQIVAIYQQIIGLLKK